MFKESSVKYYLKQRQASTEGLVKDIKMSVTSKKKKRKNMVAKGAEIFLNKKKKNSGDIAPKI